MLLFNCANTKAAAEKRTYDKGTKYFSSLLVGEALSIKAKICERDHFIWL